MAKTLPSGHSYEEMDEEELEYMKAKRISFSEGGIKVQPGDYYIPKTFLKYAERYYTFEIKPTDIFLSSFFKSGTNWLQEIVWHLIHNPNLDNPGADISIDIRCPFLEFDYFLLVKGAPEFDPEGPFLKRFQELCPGIDYRDGIFYHMCRNIPEPRLIKHHIPYIFLNPDIFEKGKMICIARDPRDVITSLYHYASHHPLGAKKLTLENFVTDFINGKVILSYWEHLRLNWEKRDHPNFHFVFYEDLKENPKIEIRKIDQFLGTKRTDEQIDNIVNCTSFSYMKKKWKHNPPTSYDNVFLKTDGEDKSITFFRKGKVGSWKEDLPLNIQDKIHAWMKENLKHFGDDFKYKVE
ncbi:UNVERIFIED_CONTAM: hypothetical protein RMT77_009611 [Armadillidium vulgare]